MDEPLDEQYLTWLYSKIGSTRTRNRSQTYWSLLKDLYSKEFVWFIPNDHNRVEDGRYLRYAFLEENDLQDVDPDWMGLGCSMLELLIGLAGRLAFEAEGSVLMWFHVLLENLGLNHHTDKDYDGTEVDEILNRVIWRTYNPDGSGGLFPLEDPDDDQREIEIWYQLSAYVLERI